MYLDITEDTRDTPNMLFGVPDITGNRLDFDPTMFRAGPIGDGSTITDAQLNFTLMSNEDDFEITDVIIREQGDFTLTGLGSAEALATVGTRVIFTITQLNGADPPDLLPTGSEIMFFTPDATGQFSLDDEGISTAEEWTGALDLDIAGFLLGVDPEICPSCADGTAFATKIEFAIDNTLTAAAANGGSAFIAKKDFNGVTITIPEPSSLGLLGVLICLAGLYRKSA
jgi:hypothetical protein